MFADQEFHTSKAGMHPFTNYGRYTLHVTYKKGFRTQVRFLIHHLAQLLHIMKRKEVRRDEEFISIDTSFRDVFSFCDALHILYTKPKTQDIDMNRWGGINIRTYKDTATKAKHEYIVIRFQDENGNDIYLKVQRRIQKSKAIKIFKRLQRKVGSSNTPSPSHSPSPSVTQPDFSPEQIPSELPMPSDDQIRPPNRPLGKRALDDISIILPNDISGNDVVVDSVDFPEGIPLPRLAVLARTLNKHVYSQYSVDANNCYWFAKSFVEVLKVLYPKHKVIEVPNRDQRGRWNGLKLYDEIDKDKLIKEYADDWNTFIQEINDTIDNPKVKALEQRVKELEATAQRVKELEAAAQRVKELEAQLAAARAQGAGIHTIASI